jgi:hypothetical protein
MRLLQIAAAALALSACAHLPGLEPSQIQRDWNRTLSDARRNVAAGNYFAADHLLDEFTLRYPGTRESREIVFWRAAYEIDPANGRGSFAGGIASLDRYLADDSTDWYRHEAIVLRRTAAAAQAIEAKPDSTAAASTAAASTAAASTAAASAAAARAAAANAASGATDTIAVVSKTREEEIASLRSQLAKSNADLVKANAELERIKKRLANPSG